MEQKPLSKMSLDELAAWKGDVTAGSANDQAANAEFMRRQVVLQTLAATAAQQEADAAARTAQFTSQNARYMLWSVLAILASSAIQAFFAFLAWKYPQH
jgi:hypothetical protein